MQSRGKSVISAQSADPGALPEALYLALKYQNQYSKLLR